MIPRLLTIWQNIRSSLWAVPLAMIGAAAALALIAVNVRLDPGGDPAWYLYSGGADNAPAFLSHMVTAMITMATLAISITVVVLTLAAQQLGSRLIYSFMRDQQTQLSLGLFVATVIYLLLVLRSTYGLGDDAPNLAVTIGTALVLISMVATLLFVHHLARSIIADNVIQKVGRLLDAEIDRLLPEKSGRHVDRPAGIRDSGASLRAQLGGYVQALDCDALVQTAASKNLTIEFDVRAGHHVLPGSVIGWVSPAAAASPDVRQAIAERVLIGPERTAVQDLEFSIRHLVEVAVRALSPGINDPFTAMAVVDRLSLSIQRVMERREPQMVWQDEDGTARVIAPVSTFEGLTDVAFHQIRQRAAKSPDVLIRMAEGMAQLMALATPEQRAALIKHARLVLECGRRNIEEKSDLQALEARLPDAAKESQPA